MFSVLTLHSILIVDEVWTRNIPASEAAPQEKSIRPKERDASRDSDYCKPYSLSPESGERRPTSGAGIPTFHLALVVQPKVVRSTFRVSKVAKRDQPVDESATRHRTARDSEPQQDPNVT